MVATMRLKSRRHGIDGIDGSDAGSDDESDDITSRKLGVDGVEFKTRRKARKGVAVCRIGLRRLAEAPTHADAPTPPYVRTTTLEGVAF